MSTPTPITAAILAGTRHGFFTRIGGVSLGHYQSLNAGLGSNDDPAAVTENRTRVRQALGAAHLVTLAQTHSAKAVTVSTPWDGPRPEADALVSNTPGLMLGVLSADCAPVLLVEPDAGVIGAAHAGWKGALDGILASVVAAMVGLGARRQAIRAAVGPTISQRAYEVGPEFVARFLDADASNARHFVPGQDDRAHFDLPGYVLAALHAEEITAEWTGHCTYSDARRFHSHRRAVHEGAPDYGRLIAGIALHD
ncbi:MAG: peptidoglycan editing factor PgeF [Pseudomonadota bacterium]